MISFLKGILQFKKPPLLIVEVNGVGYECQAPLSTFFHLPEIGCAVFLHTHFAVREDAQVLYGFFHEQERSLFRALIKVSNVGPKLALAILSGIEPERFVCSIREQDIQTLTLIPGVGKKTAERLVIELRDRLDSIGFDPLELNLVSSHHQGDLMKQDAISALIALGFKPQEASRLISKVNTEYRSAEDLIRLALQSTRACEK